MKVPDIVRPWGCGVANEGAGHCEALGRDVTDGSFDIVGNPLDEEGRVLCLHVQHLLVNLLHGHSATENCGHCEVPSISRVTSSHHILGIEHLLRQLRHSHCPILSTATGDQWGKARHKEVKTWERHHIDGELS